MERSDDIEMEMKSNAVKVDFLWLLADDSCWLDGSMEHETAVKFHELFIVSHRTLYQTCNRTIDLTTPTRSLFYFSVPDLMFIHSVYSRCPIKG